MLYMGVVTLGSAFGNTGAGGYDQKALLKMGWIPSIMMGIIAVAVGMTLYPCYEPVFPVLIPALPNIC